MIALDYYKVKEQPFGVTPDSRYLCLTSTHQEALKSLLHGIDSGCGFVALIATPGMGKTTLLLQALDILRDRARIVFLFQTISTPLDLLRALLSGLGVREVAGSLIELQIRLKELLLEQYYLNKRVVVIVDEAQNLDDAVLELVRMLSNFETSRDKLLQIILAGQPQLAENIGSPELVQLRQRISIFARLKPLTPDETSRYIAHRLEIAGYESDMPVFTRDALALISFWSEGIPRNINNVCFNALSLGAALEQKPIDRDVIRQVIADLDLGAGRKNRSLPAPPEPIPASRNTGFSASASSTSGSTRWPRSVAVAAGVLLFVGCLVLAGRQWQDRTTDVQAALPASAPQDKPVPYAHPPAPITPVPDQLPVEAAAAAGNPTLASAGSSAGAASVSESTRSGATSPAGDSVGVVSVAPGQTLLGICVANFGSCSHDLLQQLHKLNPSINNPDHIETGDKIRIPLPAAQANTP